MDSNKGQKFISLQEAAAQCEYSQEYLSLRARQGKLGAKKLGRNWVTTEEWLKEYVNQSVEPAEKEEGRFISLQEAAAQCEYSQEYLSLRARQGKLGAKKLGRNWVTTEEWLKEYIEKIKLFEIQEEKPKIEIPGKAAAVVSPIVQPFIKQVTPLTKKFYVWQAKGLTTKKSLFYDSLVVSQKVAGRIGQLISEGGQYLDNKIAGLRARAIYFFLRLKSSQEILRTWRPGLFGNLMEVKIVLLLVSLIIGGFILSQGTMRALLSKNVTELSSNLNKVVLVDSPKLISAIPDNGNLYIENFKKEISSFAVDAKKSATLIAQNSQLIFSDLTDASADFGAQLDDSLKNISQAKRIPNKILIAVVHTSEKISLLPEKIYQAIENSPRSIAQTYGTLDNQNEKLKENFRRFLSTGGEKVILSVENLSKINQLPFWAYDNYAILSKVSGGTLLDASNTVYQKTIILAQGFHHTENLAFENLNRATAIGKNNLLAGLGSLQKAGTNLNNKIISSPSIFKKASTLVLNNLDKAGGLVKQGFYASSENASNFRNVIDDKIIRAFKFLRAQFRNYRYLAQGLAQKLFRQNVTVVTSQPTPTECVTTSVFSSLSEEVAYLNSEMQKLKEGEITKYIKIENVQKTETIQKYETIQNVQTMVAPSGAFATPNDLTELELRMLAAIDKAKVSVLNYSPSNNFYNWAPLQQIHHIDDLTVTGPFIVDGSTWPNSLGSSGQVLTTAGNGTLYWSTVTSATAGGWTDNGTVVSLTDIGDYVGIGTTSPWATLSIAATSLATSPVFAVSTSTASATSTVFIINSNGLLGIGTSSPSSAFSLSINGPIYVASNPVGNNGTSTFGNGIQLTAGCFRDASNNCVGAGSGNVGASTAIGQIPYYSAVGTALSATSSIFIATNQNVGIGTTSPGALLSVAGFAGGTTPLFMISSSTAAFVTSTVFAIDANGIIKTGVWQGSVIGVAYGGTGTSTYVTGDILYADNTNSLNRLPIGTLGKVLKVAGGLPSWADDLQGGSGTGGFWATSTDNLILYPQYYGQHTVVIGGTATTTDWSTGYILEVRDGGAIFDNAIFSGNVGIGTTTPYAKLSVVGQVVSAYFTATTSATSTFAGALAVGTSTPGGNTMFEVGTSSPLLVVDKSTGYVGIGTAAPASLFSVNGTAAIGAVLINNGAGIISYNGAGTLYIGDTSNDTVTLRSGTTGDVNLSPGRNSIFTSGLVGIGTTTPNWNLQIASSTKTFLTLSDMSAATANQKHWFLSSMGGNLYIGTSSDSYATGTISALTINSNGYLGIGSSSPSQQLSLGGLLYVGGTGTSTIQNGLNAAVLNITGSATSTYANGIQLAAGCFRDVSGSCISNFTGVNVTSTNPLMATYFVATSTSIASVFPYASSTSLTVSGSTYLATTGGNVGIGTTSPNWKLSVAGIASIDDYVRASYFIATSITATSTFAGALAIGTSTPGGNTMFEVGTSTPLLMVDKSTGYVGIGTAAPLTNLHISASTPGLRLTPGAGNSSAVEFTDATPSNVVAKVSVAASTGDMSLITNNIVRLTIKNSGNVGIGTTTPGSLLSVSGSAGGNTPIFMVSTSTSGYVTSTVLTINSNGLLGIGTSSPATAFSLSISGPIYVAGNNVGGNTTSTFGTGINVASINTTGTATSTYSNGIQLAAGCFRDVSGNCVSNYTGVNVTSTNPLMATYFVATSTSIASVFPYASSTSLTVSGSTYLATPEAT